MIRVLVVDDSPFMRKILERMLESDPEISVVGSARDGVEALDKVAELDPDLVTLDVDMPRMDGLGALQRIMAEHPRPVIMVSALTEKGAEVTLQALELGALDFIPKGTGSSLVGIVRIESALCQKVRALAGKRVVTPSAGPAATVRTGEARPRKVRPRMGPARFVAVGASTGGPPALQKLFSQLTTKFNVPMVVVQHMPKAFTGPFARRLSGVGPLDVKEAASGDVLEPGKAYVAQGGSQMLVTRRGANMVLKVTGEPEDTLHKPSVDVTFASISELAIARSTLAVVLTGMGADGAEGVRALKAKGAVAIAQEANSCVVYGMPRAVVDAGLADAALPIDDIAKAIEEAIS